MTINHEMNEIAKPYVLAAGYAQDQHEALRRRVTKLRKKQQKITELIEEVDAQALLAWELYEGYDRIRRAIYHWDAEKTVKALAEFKVRNVFGDDEIAYTGIESDHYFPPTTDRPEMHSPECIAANDLGL
jgi:hypothetical protein